MFQEFENFFKKVSNGNGSDIDGKDYSKTPQRFNIRGRQIQEKKLLAEGAFGFIWLAEDVNSKEEFALKRVICMDSEKVKSALKQKQVMEKLPQSPHIVKYYGGLVLKNQGKTIVITLMELCPGGTLYDYLEKMEGKGISEAVLRKIAESILKGLKVIHEAGFAHRDVKIQNVLIGKDKKMKLCDFGSCTTEFVDFSLINKKDYDSIREEMEAFTTPMYRPPQLVDPYLKYKVNQKVDLWMTGCVIYTMAYFTHPFVEANAIGIAGAVFRFPQHPTETQYQVSEKIQDLIRNFLTPNPDYRPGSAKMLQLIQKWDNLREIPLNPQAKKVKKQHMEKESEMKKLNKKVVDIDGDIPIEQLMKIQAKIKNRQEQGEKNVSFISGKSKKPSQVKKTQKVPDYVQEVKKTNKTDEKVWDFGFGKNPGTSVKKADSFDAFNDVFASKAQKTTTAQTTNFEQLFESTPTKKVSSKPSQTNLLDL